MASSDSVVSHTAFDALQIGRSSQFVVARDFVIHGFIPAGRASFYRPSLLDVSVVKTTIDQVLDSAHVINEQKFMLRQYDHLQALANTNLELPDVVAQIYSVQGSDLEDVGVMTRVVVRFMISPIIPEKSEENKLQCFLVIVGLNKLNIKQYENVNNWRYGTQ
ncbi:unnamed protein product [Eruca vesicaria subsp. sativa]|uniref:Uncharacterized protein n=1 Tax=Eruca vesicaria subsp. sativa TaxID=29727 RepID=A0ABC8JAL9_ERUVS|nr:unnamed protein product [Eruca vesicaria subsp. sativa]